MSNDEKSKKDRQSSLKSIGTYNNSTSKNSRYGESDSRENILNRNATNRTTEEEEIDNKTDHFDDNAKGSFTYNQLNPITENLEVDNSWVGANNRDNVFCNKIIDDTIKTKSPGKLRRFKNYFKSILVNKARQNGINKINTNDKLIKKQLYRSVSNNSSILPVKRSPSGTLISPRILSGSLLSPGIISASINPCSSLESNSARYRSNNYDSFNAWSSNRNRSTLNRDLEAKVENLEEPIGVNYGDDDEYYEDGDGDRPGSFQNEDMYKPDSSQISALYNCIMNNKTEINNYYEEVTPSNTNTSSKLVDSKSYDSNLEIVKILKSLKLSSEDSNNAHEDGNVGQLDVECMTHRSHKEIDSIPSLSKTSQRYRKTSIVDFNKILSQKNSDAEKFSCTLELELPTYTSNGNLSDTKQNDNVRKLKSNVQISISSNIDLKFNKNENDINTDEIERILPPGISSYLNRNTLNRDTDPKGTSDIPYIQSEPGSSESENKSSSDKESTNTVDSYTREELELTMLTDTLSKLKLSDEERLNTNSVRRDCDILAVNKLEYINNYILQADEEDPIYDEEFVQDDTNPVTNPNVLPCECNNIQNVGAQYYTEFDNCTEIKVPPNYITLYGSNIQTSTTENNVRLNLFESSSTGYDFVFRLPRRQTSPNSNDSSNEIAHTGIPELNQGGIHDSNFNSISPTSYQSYNISDYSWVFSPPYKEGEAFELKAAKRSRKIFELPFADTSKLSPQRRNISNYKIFLRNFKYDKSRSQIKNAYVNKLTNKKLDKIVSKSLFESLKKNFKPNIWQSSNYNSTKISQVSSFREFDIVSDMTIKNIKDKGEQKKVFKITHYDVHDNSPCNSFEGSGKNSDFESGSVISNAK
ncbi:hypothetical protein TBLA_0G03030 [Henningerozyma blattae CBS 6284]|uniref:Uncharacterized protein n=1 Tax=Henningerozyma blattae (strain ATCC 34711 / CBS 6284 / DSM 70876 / NBRC 10599 / NRRL Y-10934 / UCD 77-7) TaxID=1071380 RepID=I2H788_HENB6|nr:hypothetical protein TBLA_0G03030 [Tetrapisispora blattae CBS 6284]CCH62240.1 hypothetical protein TBLA_0G03030 [Tetrapisispora blattae CBS 6284]